MALPTATPWCSVSVRPLGEAWRAGFRAIIRRHPRFRHPQPKLILHFYFLNK
jgi:hypothetical protein